MKSVLRALFILSTAIPAVGMAQSPQLPAQTPARDQATARPPNATGVVRGRVTAAADRKALSRVRVTLTGGTANAPTSVTDAEGRFEIAAVPAGAYLVSAQRAGFLTIQYGQRQPRESGRTLEIKTGEVVEGIDIALFRGAVLAGQISDESGEPASNVRVEAMQMRFLRGRRMLLQAGVATTNDIGRFRISGMEPGSYYVRASTGEMWAGDLDTKETFAYAQTFYPGVSVSDAAGSITLAIGQEAANLDFRLIAGRAARVSGVLMNAAGTPIGSQRISLSRITRGLGGALFSSGYGGAATTATDGSFEVRDLAPGEYALSSGDAQAGTVGLSLIITDADVTGLVLRPQRPGSLSGTVVTDEGTPPAFAAGRIRISPVGTGDDNILQSVAAPGDQPVRPDWSFRIASIDGPYLFRVTGLPDEWMLKAVQVGDRDITDTPLEILKGVPEITGVHLVLSRKGGTIAGEVVDKGGRPMADSTVVVFAADSSLWGPATRFVKAVRPGNNGRFTLGRLPAGRYQAIAVEFVPEGQWEDPSFLKSLMGAAQSFELTEQATTSLKLVQP